MILSVDDFFILRKNALGEYVLRCHSFPEKKSYFAQEEKDAIQVFEFPLQIRIGNAKASPYLLHPFLESQGFQHLHLVQLKGVSTFFEIFESQKK